MIQVPAKSLNHADIPASVRLLLAGERDTKVNRPSRTTHERRMEIIDNQTYIDNGTHNSRYKQDDVKEALQIQYKNKCAFCEQYAERWDVEHYRPKAIYYWLAYSWDNLLYACPTCNQDYKKEKFKLSAGNNRVAYNATDLPQIHQLCQTYNTAENPKLLHPEYDNAEPLLTFDENGKISSTNIRAKYTIRTCGLDRKRLNERRRDEVIDNLIEQINDTILEYSENPTAQQEKIAWLIDQFAKDAYNERNEFLAYRRYVLNNLIRTIIHS